MLTYTKKILSEDVLNIEKGMTYKEIIDLLGETKDIGTVDEHTSCMWWMEQNFST